MIYVASSWRNKRQPEVVNKLRTAGYECYDFRSPAEGDNGFHWSSIDPDWKGWNNKQYIDGLYHPLAECGYEKDYNAMLQAEACVLVLPCGRSAHLEAGWFVGNDIPLVILLDPESPIEPELMYRMATGVTESIEEIPDILDQYNVCPKTTAT